MTWDEALREKVAVGTPEMVIDKLQEMKETLHLGGVSAEISAGELLPADHISRSLMLFCEKVTPTFS